MRTVILYNSSWYVFLLRQNLIRSLQSAGHTVTVIAPEDRYTERVKRLGVNFVPIAMHGSGSSPIEEAVTIADVYRALRKVRADVVLSFTVKCNLYAGLCRRMLDFRHVANVSGLGDIFNTGPAVRRGVYLLYRVALARTHLIFFQNVEDQERLCASGAVDRNRTRVIPGSGVDLERFMPAQRSHRRQRAFLMFGRLLPQKGFDSFIEAARELRHRFEDRVAFWVLGAVDQSRNESLRLLQRINEAHADGIIRYLDSTDDPLPFIREADVVVLPSTYNEGVPRSLLEALACGKPVVTTDWKGCRDTVEHEGNGLLVRPNDTASLIDALGSLATCDIGMLERLGRRSRHVAEQRFDERIVLNAYLESLSPC
ncbi:MAG: glycosyltransferase family 4 protein [Pseudomonadota bacterium]|jgi:glycosyltransferase involved in cell wall biosynthesis